MGILLAGECCWGVQSVAERWRELQRGGQCCVEVDSVVERESVERVLRGKVLWWRALSGRELLRCECC